MAVSREDRMLEMLRGLRSSRPAVKAAVLVSSDALPIASDIGSGMNEDAASAMLSALIAAGERAAGDLSLGKVERIYVRADAGYIVVFQVNDFVTLACTIDPGASMEETLRDVSACARRLSQVI